MSLEAIKVLDIKITEVMPFREMMVDNCEETGNSVGLVLG